MQRGQPRQRIRSWISLAVLAVTLLQSFLTSSGPRAQQPASGMRLETVLGKPVYVHPPANRSDPAYMPVGGVDNRLVPVYARDFTHGQNSAPAPAQLWAPKGISVDHNDSLFVADSFAVDYHRLASDQSSHGPGGQQERIRKLKHGRVSTVLGGATTAAHEPAEGRTEPGRFNAVKVHDSELFAVTAIQVYKVSPGRDLEVNEIAFGPNETPNQPTDPDENVVRVAGSGELHCPEQEGSRATEGCLYHAHDIAFDHDGNMFVASLSHQAVKRVFHGGNHKIDGPLAPSESETMNIVAGGPGLPGYATDGVPALAAAIYSPTGLAVDEQGNLYISDTYNHRIRKVDTGDDSLVTGRPDEVISTVAGKGGPGVGPTFGNGELATERAAGERGWDGDGTRLAKDSYLDTPRDIEFDEAGNLYVADSENDRIRKITPGPDGEFNGVEDLITTVAGRGGGRQENPRNPGVPYNGPNACDQGCDDPLQVKLEHPYGLAIVPCEPGAATTDMYVSEWMNRRVRLISGVAECAQTDLAVEDITDSPDPVLVGNELKYTVEVVNQGASEATGVTVVARLPGQAGFRSASAPGGSCTPGAPPVPELKAVDPTAPAESRAQVTCPVGRLAPGGSATVDVLVSPLTEGKIQFAASVSALNPQEEPDLLANNHMTEDTIVKLPGLPALPILFQPPAGGSPTSGSNPPPAAGPPAPGSIDTQSTITLAPPAGPGLAGPSTAPAPVSASQPFLGEVPLTGSAGFQPGLGTAPQQISAASQAGSAATTSAMALGAAALSDASEKEAAPAIRYSMGAINGAVGAGAGIGSAMLMLSAICHLVLASRRPRAGPAPAYTTGFH